MKKFLFGVFVLLVTPSAFAFTGNDLLQQLMAYQQLIEGRGDNSFKQVGESGFGIGFIAGIFFTMGDIDPKVCLPRQGGNTAQYTAVTRQYLNNNPNQLHRPAEALVREAARQAFPCKN